MELTQSKSILAKLMATENLHIEQRNVSTASFDVEHRILTIPILDENISPDEYDLFLGHEVGHALYTPLEGLKRAFNLKLPMSVMNVIEDSRIERKIKQKYPGIRQNFIRAYRELIKKDFFGTAGKNINAYNFIDRVNLYCKGGVDLGITFNENEKLLLDEIENTQTYEDVITVCKKVAIFMEEQKKQEIEQKKQQKQQKKSSSEETEEENEDFTYGDADSEEENEESGENSTSNNENPGAGEGSSSKNVEDEKKTEEKGQESQEDEDGEDVEEPVSLTDEAYRRNENKLFSKKNKVFYYANVPDVPEKSSVVDYAVLWKRHKFSVKEMQELYMTSWDAIDVEAFQKFRNDSKSVVSYLVKEFELRKNAEQLKRASTAKTGELNMNKIYSYTFAEDIFKRVTVTPGGKSHGLIMFIDWSGSMHEYLDATIRQLLNLVMFCKKINIPYEVYAFTDDYDKGYKQPRKDGDMVIGTFSLMNLLSSRMNAVDFSYAASALLGYKNRYAIKPDWFKLGGTPLNEAVIASMNIVPSFKKQNKLQIVNTVFLTDGDGNRNFNIYDSTGRTVYTNNSAVYVIRDPKTKFEVKLDNTTSNDLTGAYLELMKRRTNCNVVGFYILTGRDFNSQIHKFFGIETTFTESENLKAEFRKNKYKIATNCGYDEYYLLKSDSLDIDDDADFEVKENATTKGFVSAFTKFNNNKKTSRVVLNRFINMIA